MIGLATKILPHNFCELIEATIKYYKGKKLELLPDFIIGGMIDASNYFISFKESADFE